MPGSLTSVSPGDDVVKPLSDLEFDGLMLGLADAQNYAVALSGGPDSTALALCTLRWARSRGKKVTGFIVEHGLRDGSATEAIGVQKRLQAEGLEVEILTWRHETISSSLQERAREARYRLLLTACHQRAIAHMLLGHHADDQVETVLLRLARGSGIDGLAGMARTISRGGVTLERPFLSIPKSRLIATCDAAGVSYVTDPGNQSKSFARGRLRRIMPLLEAEGLSQESVLDLAARASEAREALNFYAQEWINTYARLDNSGAITFPCSAFSLTPRAVTLRVLTACLRHINYGDYAPERASLLALWRIIHDKTIQKTRCLHGCILSFGEDSLTILREPEAIDDEIAKTSDGPILWDGRWWVEGEGEGILRALGNPPHDVLDRLAPGLRKQVPQGRVRASLPALWQSGTLLAVPSFHNQAALRLRPHKSCISIMD